jgi:hypothetical protein
MKSNDWGDTQDIGIEKWDNLSSPSPIQPKQTIKSTNIVSNTSSWVQDKPSPKTQTKNDWDSDAFFDDVLTSTTKPKLKTTRR